MTKKEALIQAWNEDLTFEKYMHIMSELVKQKKTSGPVQSTALIEYTKLNFSRSKRWLKQAKPSERLINLTQKKFHKVLAITEAWCGDTAQNLPFFEQLCQQLNVPYHLCFRDEHPELMNHFLTNGGKAIPIVIFMDEQFNVITTWGPRPKPLQEKVLAYKQQPEPKASYEEFAISIHEWYHSDRMQTLDQELIKLFS